MNQGSGTKLELFINNQDVSRGSYFEVRNPGRFAEIVAQVAVGNAGHVNDAVNAAHHAYAAWKNTSIHERIACLNAAATALGLSAPASAALPAHPDEPGSYYPPLRTGLRGSHPGSFETAHALRDGEAVGQALAGPAKEDYDLIVVGGGISGLSAAMFYRDKNPKARILIIENLNTLFTKELNRPRHVDRWLAP